MRFQKNKNYSPKKRFEKSKWKRYTGIGNHRISLKSTFKSTLEIDTFEKPKSKESVTNNDTRAEWGLKKRGDLKNINFLNIFFFGPALFWFWTKIQHFGPDAHP